MTLALPTSSKTREHCPGSQRFDILALRAVWPASQLPALVLLDVSKGWSQHCLSSLLAPQSVVGLCPVRGRCAYTPEC